MRHARPDAFLGVWERESGMLEGGKRGCIIGRSTSHHSCRNSTRSRPSQSQASHAPSLPASQPRDE